MSDTREAAAEAGEVAGVEDLSPTALLTLARARKSAEDQASADLLVIAAQWADLHPPESLDDAAAFTTTALGREHAEPIAGTGCPLVAEFCVAELGTVLGVSTWSAKKLIGHALECATASPACGPRSTPDASPAWRARLVAEATIHATPSLTADAAGWVDSQVASVAAKIGPAQLERLVAEAIKRYDLAVDDPYDPASDPEDGHLYLDPRHVRIDTQEVHFGATMHLEAKIDLADALDLDRQLTHHAATQKSLGSLLSLDARRAVALGDLVRTQTALDLLHKARPHVRGAKTSDGLPVAREVVLHAHFNAHTARDGQLVFGPTGRLEEGQRLILLDQLTAWCAASRTKVTVRPVIDLNTPLTAGGYAIPDRIREFVILRDRTCVFPWCTRAARRSDIDHIIPFDHTADAESRPQPGPTDTRNLAALCRFHHRLKTHTAWHYQMVQPGVFEWTSPHGHHYRRDRSGSTALDPPDHLDPPDIPQPRRR